MNNLKLITWDPNYLFLPVDGSVNYEMDYIWTATASSGHRYYKPNTFHEHTELMEEPKKIIAHLPKAGIPPLEGVMLMMDLPEREDDTKIYSEACRIYDVNDVFNQYAIGGYVRGYKAASKQYTEDDIDAAFLAGSNHQSEVEELRFQAEDFNTALNRFKDSLSPVPVLPVDFMIEYQQAPSFNDFMPQPNIFRPKTISNEQGVEVLQGKWIY